MSAPPTAMSRMPPPSVTHPAAPSHGRSEPALTFASTLAEPSAFMTTTDQLPLRTFHSSVCVPSPLAVAILPGVAVEEDAAGDDEAERHERGDGARDGGGDAAGARARRGGLGHG